MKNLVMNLRQHERTELSPLKPICDAMNHQWTYSGLRKRFVCRDCFAEMAGALAEGALPK